MPCDVSLENDGSRVFVRYYGRLTTDELYESARKRFADPQQLESFEVIMVDYSDVTEMEINDLNIKVLASCYSDASKLVSGVIVAVICPSDLQYGLGRMWQGYIDDIHWEHMVFRTHDEANTWVETKLLQKAGAWRN